MAIPEALRTNFDTLIRVAAQGDLALVDGTDAATGGPCSVVCAVGRDGPDVSFIPFGHLRDGNRIDAYVPPR